MNKVIQFPNKQGKTSANYLRSLMYALGKYDAEKVWEKLRDKK